MMQAQRPKPSNKPSQPVAAQKPASSAPQVAARSQSAANDRNQEN